MSIVTIAQGLTLAFSTISDAIAVSQDEPIRGAKRFCRTLKLNCKEKDVIKLRDAFLADLKELGTQAKTYVWPLSYGRDEGNPEIKIAVMIDFAPLTQ